MTQTERELLEALKEYVRNDDASLPLNGINTKARVAIAKAEAEQAERVETAKDVNSTHAPVAWQVWVGADTHLNAPMGWQFYNTYDSLRSAEATARTINAAQQSPFAKIVPLYTTPPAAGVSGPLTDEQIDKAWRSVDYIQPYEDFRIAIARAIESAHNIRSK